jgi:flagellar FliL protein
MSDPAPARGAAKGFKGSLTEIAIVVLIGAAVGAAFEATRQGEASAANPDPAAAQLKEPSSVYDLPPIVTNLAAPQDTWIRLEGSIVFDPKVLLRPEAAAAELGDDILAYLRTLTLKQLEGPVGLENLRQDLNERAATRTGGKTRELVIRTLVVQ